MKKYYLALAIFGIFAIIHEAFEMLCRRLDQIKWTAESCHESLLDIYSKIPDNRPEKPENELPLE